MKLLLILSFAHTRQLPVLFTASVQGCVSIATLTDFKGWWRRCGRCCMIYCWPVAAACSVKTRLPRNDAPRSVRMRLKTTESEPQVKNPCPPAGHSSKPLTFKTSAHIRRSKSYCFASVAAALTSRDVTPAVCRVLYSNVARDYIQ